MAYSEQTKIEREREAKRKKRTKQIRQKSQHLHTDTHTETQTQPLLMLQQYTICTVYWDNSKGNAKHFSLISIVSLSVHFSLYLSFSRTCCANFSTISRQIQTQIQISILYDEAVAAKYRNKLRETITKTNDRNCHDFFFFFKQKPQVLGHLFRYGEMIGNEKLFLFYREHFSRI